jgi:hypothetical protein
MIVRRLSKAAVAASLLLSAAPVAGASADAGTAPPGTQSTPGLVFIAPRVGPLCVDIGAIIIGGRITSPGMHVCTTGTALPPISLQPGA